MRRIVGVLGFALSLSALFVFAVLSSQDWTVKNDVLKEIISAEEEALGVDEACQLIRQSSSLAAVSWHQTTYTEVPGKDGQTHWLGTDFTRTLSPKAGTVLYRIVSGEIRERYVCSPVQLE